MGRYSQKSEIAFLHNSSASSHRRPEEHYEAILSRQPSTVLQCRSHPDESGRVLRPATAPEEHATHPHQFPLQRSLTMEETKFLNSFRTARPPRANDCGRRSSLQQQIRRQASLPSNEARLLESVVKRVPEQYVGKLAQSLESISHLYELPATGYEQEEENIVSYSNQKKQRSTAALAKHRSAPLNKSSAVYRKQNQPSIRNQLWTRYKYGSHLSRVSSSTPVSLYETEEEETDMHALAPASSEATDDSLLWYKETMDALHRFWFPCQRPLANLFEEQDDDDSCDLSQRSCCTGLSTLPSYSILGISVDDCEDYVLSPPLMDALRRHLPFAIRSDHFWLKYSPVRGDGLSMRLLLQKVCHSSKTILAIETLDGHVLGAFASAPWQPHRQQYYGNGQAFLFRLQHPRRNSASSSSSSSHRAVSSLAEEIRHETAVEVFPWTGHDDCVQRLSHVDAELMMGQDGGLVLQSDLQSGYSHPSPTFDNPSLVSGGEFEVVNVEVWTLTPVDTLAQAETLELGRRFLFDHSNAFEV